MDKEDVERICQLLIEIRDAMCSLDYKLKDVCAGRDALAVREQSSR